MPALEEKKSRPRRGLTFKLADAGISLPEALTQKQPRKRHKKSGGKERPPSHHQQGAPKKMENETVHVPPAGGTNGEAESLAKTFVEALRPAVRSFEDAGNRVLTEAKSADIKVRALNVAEFSLKGAVALGFATAAGYIGRSIWRGRNAHLATD